MPINPAQVGTLSFNGTDTYFQPSGYIPDFPLKPTVREPIADRSETISFIAACITRLGIDSNTTELFGTQCTALQTMTLTAQKGDYFVVIDPPLDARLIEGPDTRGTLVFQKIAEGTASLLGSILEGRTTLNIQGHSRGAIQAILVAHELDRIKKALGDSSPDNLSSKDLLEKIYDSPDRQIKGELKRLLLPLQHKPDVLDTLKRMFKENDIRVNLCLLDPVPGNTVLNLPGIGWYDERYFKLPYIVENAQITICENEDTGGFDCVIPEAIDATRTHVNVHKLWGHHGTLTGNPFGNNGESLASLGVNEGTAEHAQHVALYESYNFLSANGTAFKRMENDYPLTSIYNAYHEADPRGRKRLLLEAYDRMKANQPAYKAMNETVYIRVAGIDFHEAFDKPYRDTKKTRPVLESINHKRSSLEVRLPFKSDQFVNEVHAQLFLELRLGLDLGSDNRPFEQMVALIEKLHSEESVPLLENGLRDENTRKNAIDSIQSLVAKLVQLYLQNNLSAEEKEGTLNAINQALAIDMDGDFSSAGARIPSSPPPEGPLDSLKRNLKNNLNDHLIDQIERQVKAHYDDLAQLILFMRAQPAQAEEEIEINDERPAADKRMITGFVNNAFEKHKQFIVFKDHLMDLKQKIDPCSKLAGILPEKMARLQIYADITIGFCAKTISEKKLDIAIIQQEIDPSQDSSQFLCQITAILNGLSGLVPALQEHIASAASHSQFLGFEGISLQVLSGFVSVLGAAAVALAFTALAMGALSTLPATALLIGGVALMSLGMFGISSGARGKAYQEVGTLLLDNGQKNMKEASCSSVHC